MRYLFADYVLDTDRRELRRGADLVAVTPQAFDLLDFLIRHRHCVVSRDDLIAAIWRRRVISDSALTTRINAARNAIGDSARQQRMIKTLPRKGVFVSSVRCGKSRSPLTRRMPIFLPGRAATRPLCRKGLPSRCFPSRTCPTIGSWHSSPMGWPRTC